MVNIITCVLVVFLSLCLVLGENIITPNDVSPKATVVKVDKMDKENGTVQDVVSPTTELVVVISEKSLAEIQADETHKKETSQQMPNIDKPKTGVVESENSKMPNEYDQVLKHMDIDLESSVRTGFYILMTISVGALLFVSWKIYKLRLSRAERKYGVQGNRTPQELAPLPLSMEDPDSDDENQTIFDAHRQQFRIF